MVEDSPKGELGMGVSRRADGDKGPLDIAGLVPRGLRMALTHPVFIASKTQGPL